MFLSVKLTDEDEAPVTFKTPEQLELYIKKGCLALRTETKGENYGKKKFINVCIKKIIHVWPSRV